VGFDLAGGAGLVVESIRILNVARATARADGQIQLVVVGNAQKQVKRPLKTQQRPFVQQQIRFVSPTHPVTEIDVRSGPAGMYIVVGVYAQQQAAHEQCHEGRSLQLILRVLDEKRHLAGRLAAAAAYAAIAEVPRIEFADAIIGQARTFANRAGSRLMANHPEGELELAAFRRIAVVGEAHILPFMLEIDHI
jgi:hypothetical protein